MLERKWSDEQRAKVRRLREEGHSLSQISKIMGMPESSAQAIINKAAAGQAMLRPGSHVSVFLTDGEAIPFATIKRQDATSITLDVECHGEVIVFKNALKKIIAAALPVSTTVEFTE